MFVITWILYTSCVALFAFGISFTVAKIQSSNQVEEFIDQIIERSKKISLEPVNGIKTLKIEKVNKYTLKEYSQFVNLGKTEIFLPTTDMHALKEETTNNIKSFTCERNLKESIANGLVYQAVQYDKNMELLMSATVKKGCNIEVLFLTNKVSTENKLEQYLCFSLHS